MCEVELDGGFFFINNNHLPDVFSILDPFQPQWKDKRIALLRQMEFQSIFASHPIDKGYARVATWLMANEAFIRFDARARAKGANPR